nr:hypothetical protein [Planctomycetota bacterium]
MLKVGFDIRPALFDYAGIHRYVRELGVALTQLDDGPFLEMFAPAWRGERKIPAALVANRHRMNKGFLPVRAMKLFNRLPGLDSGRYPATRYVFHSTDFTFSALRSLPTLLTMHDAPLSVPSPL